MKLSRLCKENNKIEVLLIHNRKLNTRRQEHIGAVIITGIQVSKLGMKQQRVLVHLLNEVSTE